MPYILHVRILTAVKVAVVMLPWLKLLPHFWISSVRNFIESLKFLVSWSAWWRPPPCYHWGSGWFTPLASPIDGAAQMHLNRQIVKLSWSVQSYSLWLGKWVRFRVQWVCEWDFVQMSESHSKWVSLTQSEWVSLKVSESWALCTCISPLQSPSWPPKRNWSAVFLLVDQRRANFGEGQNFDVATLDPH